GKLGADQAAALKIPQLRPGIALVLGNEETGLSPEVKENCSALVRIPGTGNIESLNVAQAAALFLHEIYEL
ncbi:MAG: RNA methyltransferase, partial [Treponema sp.]|nr:RNA methyltransferase [Treponema sp.]